MQKKCKLYSLNNIFIGNCTILPTSYTGIAIRNGSKYWFKDGLRHRLDGPAIEFGSGLKYWFINDKYVTELECKLLRDIMKLKGLLK